MNFADIRDQLTISFDTELNAIDGVLCDSVVMYVLDGVSGQWSNYAVGCSLEWFLTVIRDDAIMISYSGIRIVTQLDNIAFELFW
jgi:hypothetical protein